MNKQQRSSQNIRDWTVESLICVDKDTELDPQHIPRGTIPWPVRLSITTGISKIQVDIHCTCSIEFNDLL